MEMNKQEKREQLIESRNLLGEVFHSSKEDWCDTRYCRLLTSAMGSLDLCIQQLRKDMEKSSV